jgi:hypothetical protein
MGPQTACCEQVASASTRPVLAREALAKLGVGLKADKGPRNRKSCLEEKRVEGVALTFLSRRATRLLPVL